MNDLNFTSRIVRSIAARGAAGHKYSYGVSNGADHSQRIAASAVVAYDALPFSAIAANSAQLMATPARAGPGPYNWNSLNSGRPVAQLAFHGTNDSTIAYEGGPKFGNTTFILMSEPESNKAWAVHNGCKSTISNTTVTAVIKGGAQCIQGFERVKAFNFHFVSAINMLLITTAHQYISTYPHNVFDRVRRNRLCL